MVTAFWEELMRIARQTDAQPINQFPNCWEIGIHDAGWFVAVNAHETPKPAAGSTVPPFTALVLWNGWPAGVINPQEGTIAAGEAANMDTLMAWLRDQ